MSKCGKNISDTLGYLLVCHFFVLTTFWCHLGSINHQQGEIFKSNFFVVVSGSGQYYFAPDSVWCVSCCSTLTGVHQSQLIINPFPVITAWHSYFCYTACCYLIIWRDWRTVVWTRKHKGIQIINLSLWKTERSIFLWTRDLQILQKAM